MGNPASYAIARRRARQRGSALLVVLVFAAIVAIMLYKELPIAAFEAQRQKEELLISRGNEYKRGVRLFVRKIGRFPSSIAELENTNRMRFLRRRYTDPLTGKDDWRLIHAGAGGVIIDSQVKSNTNGPGATPLGQGAVFAGFNNSFSGDETAAADNTAPSAGMRQRAAATKNAVQNNDPLAIAAGGGDANADPNAAAAGGNGEQLPNGQAGTNGVLDPNAAPGVNTGGPPAAGAGISTIAQQLNNQNPQMAEKAGAASTSGFGNTTSFGSNGQQQNGTTGTSLTGGNGQISGAGGIAGVASVAPGRSIKAVNDQTKYKLWEFYYDLRKEQAGAQQAAAQSAGMQNSGTQNSGQSGTGSSGSSTFSSGFGTTSGFGQSQAAPSQNAQPTSGPLQ